MRVPDQQVFAQSDQSIKAQRAKLDQAVRETSTGIRVQHPWDDPAAAGRAALHQASETRLRSVAEGAARAKDELLSVDNAMSRIGDDLQRARDLAVQMANDTVSTEDRANAATELGLLRDSIIGALNQEVAGRYIFGGHQDQAPPFDPAGVYVGDSGERRIEIAPGVFEIASVRGDLAMGSLGVGVDVFAELANLEAALLADDAAAISTAIEGIDLSHRQVTDLRSEAGTRFTVFSAAEEASSFMADDDKTAAARLTDADLIESAQSLSMAQTALDAALAAGARSFRSTILDHLR